MKQLLDLPSEILSSICNIHLTSTRDKISFGLVCSRLRKLLNWEEHDLELVLSHDNEGTDSLNGSDIPVSKWPALVEILLEKDDLTIASFSLKSFYSEDRHQLSAALHMHEMADLFLKYKHKFHLKLLTIRPFSYKEERGLDCAPNNALLYAVDHLVSCIPGQALDKIEHFTVSEVKSFEHLIEALNGAALKQFRCKMTIDGHREPVDIFNGLKPKCLKEIVLVQDRDLGLMQYLCENVSPNAVSEVEKCFFKVNCSLTEVSQLLMPWIAKCFPKLEKCHLRMLGRIEEVDLLWPEVNQVLPLVSNYFQLVSQFPKFGPVEFNVSLPRLHVCAVARLLEHLNLTNPNIKLKAKMRNPYCTFGVGEENDRIEFNIQRDLCDDLDCRVCRTDSAMLLSKLQFLYRQCRAEDDVNVDYNNPAHTFSLRFCELDEMIEYLEGFQTVIDFNIDGCLMDENLRINIEAIFRDRPPWTFAIPVIPCENDECKCRLPACETENE